MSRSHVMYSLGGTVVMPSDHIGHSDTEADAMSYELDGIVTPEDQDTASMAAWPPIPPAEVPDSPDQGICDEFAAACGDAGGLRVALVAAGGEVEEVAGGEAEGLQGEGGGGGGLRRSRRAKAEPAAAASPPMTAASPPMTAEAALRQAEAEGLSLVRSDNKTGYSGVHPHGKRYQAMVQRGGGRKHVSLGTFDTREEAALCVAQSPEGKAKAEAAAAASPPMTAEAALRQAEAEGLSLVLSDNQTGYWGVRPNDGKGYQATVTRGGKTVGLGTFDTPEEAALCVAQSPEGKAKAEAVAATSPPMTAEAALRQAEAEGLSLVLADSKTGYSGVRPNGKRYQAMVTRGGKLVGLGTFDTPEEAALCVAQSPEGKAKAAAAATPAEPAKRARPAEPAEKRKATETSAEVLARVAAAARKKRLRSAGPLDDGLGHRSGEACANATLRAAQERILPLTRDDDMTAHSSDRLTAQLAKRLAHAAVVKAAGGQSRTFVIDASTSASQLNLDAATLDALKKWHEAFVTKADAKTAGSKRSKLVKSHSTDLKELWDILGPVYGKLGFQLYEANAILYPSGEISWIYPHLDSHHHFKERLTVVLELTPTTKPEESLHFSMSDGEEMRMPQGEQLLSVSTSGAMVKHYAYVSGGCGERRSLALFLYLEDFENELEAGERTEPRFFPSGPLQAIHDAHVEVILKNEPRRDLETGSAHVLDAIGAAAASDDDGSAKAAVPSSSATPPSPQPRGAKAQRDEEMRARHAAHIRHALEQTRLGLFNEGEWDTLYARMAAEACTGKSSGKDFETVLKAQARTRPGMREHAVDQNTRFWMEGIDD